MFVNGLEIGTDGRIVTSQAAAAAGDAGSGGFSYDKTTGGVKADVLTPLEFANGFGFNAGMLCIGAGPAVSFQNGLGFNALRQLVVDGAGGAVSYRGGWPLSSAGLAIQAIVPPSSLNPADANGCTLSNGNMTATTNGSGGVVRSTNSHTTGKWYMEMLVVIPGSLSNRPELGLMIAGATNFNNMGPYDNPASYGITPQSPPTSHFNYSPGNISGNTTIAPGVGAASVMRLAYDGDGHRFWTAVDANWDSGNPATLTGPSWTGMTGAALFYTIGLGNGGCQCTARFKAAQMTFPVPAGFTCWGDG